VIAGRENRPRGTPEDRENKKWVEQTLTHWSGDVVVKCVDSTGSRGGEDRIQNPSKSKGPSSGEKEGW